MADVVYVVSTLAFFGLCVAYVRGLDRLVGTALQEPGEAGGDTGR